MQREIPKANPAVNTTLMALTFYASYKCDCVRCRGERSSYLKEREGGKPNGKPMKSKRGGNPIHDSGHFERVQGDSVGLLKRVWNCFQVSMNITVRRNIRFMFALMKCAKGCGKRCELLAWKSVTNIRITCW